MEVSVDLAVDLLAVRAQVHESLAHGFTSPSVYQPVGHAPAQVDMPLVHNSGGLTTVEGNQSPAPSEMFDANDSGR
jgi:hypothetical protein